MTCSQFDGIVTGDEYPLVGNPKSSTKRYPAALLTQSDQIETTQRPPSESP